MEAINSLKEETTSELEIAKGMADLLPAYKEKAAALAERCAAARHSGDPLLGNGLGRFLPSSGETLAQKFRRKTMQAKLAKSPKLSQSVSITRNNLAPHV